MDFWHMSRIRNRQQRLTGQVGDSKRQHWLDGWRLFWDQVKLRKSIPALSLQALRDLRTRTERCTLALTWVSAHPPGSL
jgi:hypothetical protein